MSWPFCVELTSGEIHPLLRQTAKSVMRQIETPCGRAFGKSYLVSKMYGHNSWNATMICRICCYVPNTEVHDTVEGEHLEGKEVEPRRGRLDIITDMLCGAGYDVTVRKQASRVSRELEK
jgi:hypothetical protein